MITRFPGNKGVSRRAIPENRDLKKWKFSFFLQKIIACRQVWAKSHSLGDYKNVKVYWQCMSLMEKNEFNFFYVPIFRYWPLPPGHGLGSTATNPGAAPLSAAWPKKEKNILYPNLSMVPSACWFVAFWTVWLTLNTQTEERSVLFFVLCNLSYWFLFWAQWIKTRHRMTTLWRHNKNNVSTTMSQLLSYGFPHQVSSHALRLFSLMQSAAVQSSPWVVGAAAVGGTLGSVWPPGGQNRSDVKSDQP